MVRPTRLAAIEDDTPKLDADRWLPRQRCSRAVCTNAGRATEAETRNLRSGTLPTVTPRRDRQTPNVYVIDGALVVL